MNLISICLAEPTDLDAARALFEAQLREHEMSIRAEELGHVIQMVMANPQFGFILLAKADGKAIGVAYAAAHLSVEHAGFIGCLEELYVTPAARNAGIGSRLLAEVLTRSRQLGWRGIELEVVAGHERVNSLYLRHGFQALSRNRFCRLFAGD